MASYSEDVIAYNLLKGIPFPNDQFEVVYHSQVLEHFPKEKASDFIKECHRVLKPGGVIRVVVPDLENIVDEYKKYLNENLNNPNALSEANYEWILLEMFDQTVRNYSGGLMAEYLKRPKVINENYVIDRIGYEGRKIREQYLNPSSGRNKLNVKKALSSFSMLLKAIHHVLSNVFQSKTSKVGSFRLGGEIHMWMYDRSSLSKLLKDCGFENISIKNPFESEIQDWSKYELDVKDGLAFDPTSLFIEAKKR